MSSRHGRMLPLAPLAVLVLVVFGTGSASAGLGCDNWQGPAHGDWSNTNNWSTGTPGPGVNVCINTGGPVLISGESETAATLTMTGSQELDIEAKGSNSGTLTLTGNSSIGAGSKVVLEADCSVSCAGGLTSVLTMSGGTLTNSGQIASEYEHGSDTVSRQLNGNIDNQGTGVDTSATGNGINVQAQLEYGASTPINSTLDNQGTIAVASQMRMTVPFGGSSTVINATGGSITNGDGSGAVLIGAHDTFEQGGGTTTPHGTLPNDPVVIVDGSSLGTTVKYTGTGVSTIQVRDLDTLNGSLANGQNLVVNGVNSGGCPESLLTSAASFTNAGTITITGPCESGVKVSSGALTNTGTIVAQAQSGADREIKGNLTNHGTLNIQAPTVFDGPGTTLTQTAGTTTISPSQFLDLTGSSGTFLLKAGLLQSPGSNATHQGSITGSLNNSGGNVTPGSTSTPGDFTVTGHYTQGAGGKLTAVIAGTSAGKTYSQLGVGGGSTLGGTLAIVTHSGFHPLASQLFTVLGGSTDGGKFARLTGQFPAGGIGYKPLYDKTDVTLEGTPAAKLTVKLAGTKKGTVTSSPGGISCGATCVASFFKPQTVTLTEHPISGHKFKGWSGACTGKTTTCKVKMTKAQSVTATFS